MRLDFGRHDAGFTIQALTHPLDKGPLLDSQGFMQHIPPNFGCLGKMNGFPFYLALDRTADPDILSMKIAMDGSGFSDYDFPALNIAFDAAIHVNNARADQIAIDPHIRR